MAMLTRLALGFATGLVVGVAPHAAKARPATTARNGTGKRVLRITRPRHLPRYRPGTRRAAPPDGLGHSHAELRAVNDGGTVSRWPFPPGERPVPGSPRQASTRARVPLTIIN